MLAKTLSVQERIGVISRSRLDIRGGTFTPGAVPSRAAVAPGRFWLGQTPAIPSNGASHEPIRRDGCPAAGPQRAGV